MSPYQIHINQPQKQCEPICQQQVLEYEHLRNYVEENYVPIYYFLADLSLSIAEALYSHRKNHTDPTFEVGLLVAANIPKAQDEEQASKILKLCYKL
jgi:hypothetical protein